MSVKLLPAQKADAPLIVTLGKAFTVTEMVLVLAQPVAVVVAVTV